MRRGARHAAGRGRRRLRQAAGENLIVVRIQEKQIAVLDLGQLPARQQFCREIARGGAADFRFAGQDLFRVAVEIGDEPSLRAHG
jgi:hypothetical protein